MEPIYYVYQYIDEYRIPYYIGKGKDDRIHAKHLYTIVPEMQYRQFIAKNLTELDAYKLETKLVEIYGRKIDGGLLDNIRTNRWTRTSGWKHKEETKRIISEKNKGKIRTEQQKQNYRHPKSKEHAEKIRQANLGRPRDSRYEKISATTKGRKWSTAAYAARGLTNDVA